MAAGCGDVGEPMHPPCIAKSSDERWKFEPRHDSMLLIVSDDEIRSSRLKKSHLSSHR